MRATLALAATTITCAAPGAAAANPATSARAVFDQNCARCHEAARLENPPSKGGLGNILDLERLSAREDLVAPSDPDASRLYQIILSQHRPQSVFFGPVPGPTPAEIGAVRDWLAALPPRARCAERPPVTRADVEHTVATWREAFETDPSQPLRFVSLANLHNLCRSDSDLAAYRDAVAMLLARLTLRPVTSLDTVGEASAILAFRPSDVGLTAEAWDLRASSTEGIAGVVSAEKLAARAAQSGIDSSRILTGAIAAPAPADNTLVAGLDPVVALALEFTRTVKPERAAVELGIDDAALREQLDRLTGHEATLAMRLLQTGLPRVQWEELMARLTGRPAATATPDATPANHLSLALWSNALTYKAGDLLTLHAKASGDCNLTVVAVEAGGLATVLFPNDSATDNRINAGVAIQIPAPSAPFQLRLDKPGRHGMVAVCNATAKRPQGIGHDFERQRFTVLGDWRTFLLETAEREATYQKTQDDLRRFRTGAGPAAALELQLPMGTEDEARAALALDVAP